MSILAETGWKLIFSKHFDIIQFFRGGGVGGWLSRPPTPSGTHLRTLLSLKLYFKFLQYLGIRNKKRLVQFDTFNFGL